MKKKLLKISSAVFAGFINGFFGAGAGLLIIPALRKVFGLDGVKAHATCVAAVLPLSAASALMYTAKEPPSLSTGGYIIGGLLAVIPGVLLLSKINKNILKRAFGIFMIITALRLLLK